MYIENRYLNFSGLLLVKYNMDILLFVDFIMLIDRYLYGLIS